MLIKFNKKLARLDHTDCLTDQYEPAYDVIPLLPVSYSINSISKGVKFFVPDIYETPTTKLKE